MSARNLKHTAFSKYGFSKLKLAGKSFYLSHSSNNQ